MDNILIDVSRMTRNFTQEELDRLYELTYNGPMILPKEDGDHVPAPWDAGFSVEDAVHPTKGPYKEMRITGGVGSHGFGYCECRLPLKYANDYYEFVLEPYTEEGALQIVEILEAVGASRVTE